MSRDVGTRCSSGIVCDLAILLQLKMYLQGLDVAFSLFVLSYNSIYTNAWFYKANKLLNNIITLPNKYIKVKFPQ